MCRDDNKTEEFIFASDASQLKPYMESYVSTAVCQSLSPPPSIVPLPVSRFSRHRLWGIRAPLPHPQRRGSPSDLVDVDNGPERSLPTVAACRARTRRQSGLASSREAHPRPWRSQNSLQPPNVRNYGWTARGVPGASPRLSYHVRRTPLTPVRRTARLSAAS